MTTTELVKQIAEQRGLAVGVVYDPKADPHECWVATIGLDSVGAGGWPGAALGAALLDLEGYERPDPVTFLFGAEGATPIAQPVA